MSRYATLNGVNRKLGEGWGTVNGVYRNLGTGFVTQNGVWKKCFSSGLPLTNLPVGSLVLVPYNGSTSLVRIVNQGNPNASFYDASCDGTWMWFTSSLYNQRCDDSYAKGIHPKLNGEKAFDNFNQSMKNIIKTVKIPYNQGATIYSGANGLESKLFLLGVKEIGLSSVSGRPNDGERLEYFASDATNKRKLGGYWLTRATNTGGSYNITITNTGSDYFAEEDTTAKIYPAFILPSEAVVNPEPNADGSYTLLV